METRLIQFNNAQGNSLRGILIVPENSQDNLVVMAGGFDRSATTEKKFKALADGLAQAGIASFRFDYTGRGLSDGEFRNMTVASLTDDLARAIDAAKNEINLPPDKKVSIVAHSLSSCAVALLAQKLDFEKIVLLAPALNQKELLRYWFVLSSMKELGSDLNVTWGNFHAYLSEESFLEDAKREGKMTKRDYINPDYYLENLEKDYSEILKDKNVLEIHGDADLKVPLESVTVDFPRRIVVEGGDHDLERPDMLEQWLPEALEFLKEA